MSLAYSIMLYYSISELSGKGEGVQTREDTFTFTSVVSDIRVLVAFPRKILPLFQRKSMDKSYASNH